MAKYINIDRLKDMVEAKADTLIEGGQAFYYIAKWLDLLPGVEAVEVIRCKDCAVPHSQWTGCPKLNGLVTPPDFYCSRGERRKEDAEIH